MAWASTLPLPSQSCFSVLSLGECIPKGRFIPSVSSLKRLLLTEANKECGRNTSIQLHTYFQSEKETKVNCYEHPHCAIHGAKRQCKHMHAVYACMNVCIKWVSTMEA